MRQKWAILGEKRMKHDPAQCSLAFHQNEMRQLKNIVMANNHRHLYVPSAANNAVKIRMMMGAASGAAFGTIIRGDDEDDHLKKLQDRHERELEEFERELNK
jgi:hypothetical protein